MIHIDTIEAWNFMVFEHVFLDLRDAGLVFLIGHPTQSTAYSNNHTGKSSLMSILPWGVWGETIKDIPNSKGVIRNGASEAVVHICGRNDDKSFVIKRRCTKRNIFLETDLVSSDRQADAQKEIDRQLRSFRASKNTVLLEQGRAIEFVTGTPVVRQQIIEDLRGLDRYRQAHKKAAEELKGWKIQLEEFQRTKAVLIARYNEEKTHLDNLVALAQERQNASRQPLEQALYTVQLQHVELRSEVTALRNTLIELTSESPNSMSAVENRHSMAVSKLAVEELNLDGVRKSLLRWSSTTICEACHTPLTHEPPIWKELQQREQELLASIPVLVKERDDATDNLTRARYHQDQVSRTRYQLEQKVKTITDLMIQISGLELELSKLDWPAPVMDTTALDAIAQEIRGIDWGIDQITPYLPYLEICVQALHRDGIPAESISQSIPLLNSLLGELMEEMTDGELNSQIANKSLDMNVWQNGKLTPYVETSAGQRRRIAIGLFLSMAESLLRQTGQDWSCRFIDELFDVLDQTGIEKVMSILQRLTKTTVPTIIVASQRGDLKSMDCFDQVWTIVCEGDQRSLVVDKR